MSEPMEVQDAVASTLATPFAQPIIAAPKSKAQKQREYRQRIAASRTPAQAAAARKSKNERQRNNRLRQAANLAIASGSLEANTTPSSRSGEESNNVQTRSQHQHAHQKSTTTADQPDERVNLTNEPLFPPIPVPMEVQEAVASASVTPFAEPITAAPKTRAQIQHEYRQRIAASRTLAQAAAAREARNVRDRNNRLCQAANLAIASGSLEATTTSSSRSGKRLNTVHIDTQGQFTNQQCQTLATEPAETTVQPSTSSDQIEVQAQSTWNTKWASSIMRFKSSTAAQLKLYDVSLSQNIKISYEQISCPYENYTYKIRDGSLKLIEKDMLKKDQIKEEPCSSTEEVSGDNNASVKDNAPWINIADSDVKYEVNDPDGIKEEPYTSAEDVSGDNNASVEDNAPMMTTDIRSDRKHGVDDPDEIKEEPCTSAEDVSGGNDASAEANAPLVTVADIRSDGKHGVDDPDEIKDVVLPKQLKRSSSNEESQVETQHSRGAVIKQCITQTTRKKFKVNDVLPKLKVANANEIIKQNDVGKISDEQFSCDFCAYSTNSKYSLTRHLRTHTVEKPFSCNICSYKCSKKSSLTQHLRTHTGEKPFSCNTCSFKCSQKGNLTNHLRIHTGEKPFSCNICSFKCSMKSSLTLHSRTHTGEKPFSCNICSFKCSHTSNLTMHLRTHTGEKPFFCNICSFKCSQKSYLTRHLRTHTGEKPFSCNICSFKCSQKSYLTKHLRTHTGEKPFSCNICSFKCSYASNLSIHLRTHTGEKQ